MALATQQVSESQFLRESSSYHFSHNSPPTPTFTPELLESVQSLYQIQHISATIADLAKSAQLNAGDHTYVLRARSEIAQLSSLLISYSINSELRKPKMEPKEEVRVPSLPETATHKRKHKAISTQNLYCRSCGTTQTPEWRRGPDGGKSLCNACGLHYAKIVKREVMVPARKTETTAQAMNLRTLLN